MQAFEQGDSSDECKLRMIPQYVRQSIGRNSTAQMMDVVNAYVGGEPAQHIRQMK
jgi:hypothetical protein